MPLGRRRWLLIQRCMEMRLKYPVSTADFESIVGSGLVYVDKTRYIHELAGAGKYFFLSRPRRFGKSMLLNTFEAYFKGKRELFEGLEISKLEPGEWKKYPVLSLNLAGMAYNEPSDLADHLIANLRRTAKAIDVELLGEGKPETRFAALIDDARAKHGADVVVLVDEYDAPLTDTIDRPDLQGVFRDQLRAFYSVLKNADKQIRFCMLTGVTRYGKMTVFSGLNNLYDITFDDTYAGICGITEEELHKYYQAGVEAFAEKNSVGVDDAFKQLKHHYDGYHFSPLMLDVYNPFSINHALQRGEISDYWCASGTPTILVKFLAERNYSIDKLNREYVYEADLENLSMHSDDPAALFYQTGYLTLKGYERSEKIFQLGYPNREVEDGILRNILDAYMPVQRRVQRTMINDMRRSLEEGEPETFIAALNEYFAAIPVDLRKHVARYENYYHTVVYCIATLIGMDVEAEYGTSEGYIDLVIKTDRFIYLIELKVNGTAADAMEQIERKRYAERFAGDKRRTVCIGIGFSKETHNVGSYEVSF